MATINLSELDIDLLEDSFIEWLKTQPIFRDFEFTGSNIKVLIDLLAKNTNANSFLLNMIASEAFLNSAQLRDSAVSKAKELNYTPRSWRSASATLNITITTPNAEPTVVVIPKGTAFTTRVDDQVFTFSTDETLSAVVDSYIPASNAYQYVFEDVAIYEGTTITESFTVNTSIENQRFVLSNKNIDTDSITVTVVNSASDSANTEYTYAESLLNVDSTSTIYFVQATDGDKYEIEFGDGVLGSKPINGNIIQVEYRITSGPDANGAETFRLVSSAINGYTQYEIEVVDVARGGAEQESLQSIQYNAPKHYQTQGKAQAYQDFETILRRQFPEIRAINVYGGDEVVPPKFGKVIISIDLEDFDGVPTSKKEAIETFIAPKMVRPIRPEVINPDFSFIEITSDIQYSLNQTTKSVDDIKALVTDAITDYSDTNLDDFDCKFRFSKIETAIDAASSAITGSNLVTRLYKKLTPISGTAWSGSLKFQNELIEGTVQSTPFVYNSINAFLVDDSVGGISIATTQNGNTVTLVRNIGTVDYVTGTIAISSLNVESYTSDYIKLAVSTAYQDIVSSQNTILSIGTESITVNVTPVVTSA